MTEDQSTDNKAPKSPLVVLLLDDNPDDRLLAKREIEKAFPDVQVKEVVNAKDFTRALEKGGFDAVITDYQLRWSDGLRVLEKVKDRYPLCPVIMFTATGNEEIAVLAMKRGLDDYILKSPKHFIRLPASINSVLKRATEKEKRQETERKLRQTQRDWEAVFQSIGNPTIILDPQFHIMEVNKTLENLLGTPAQELKGQECYRIFHHTEKPPKGCPTEKLLASKDLKVATNEIDALGIPFLVSCTPVVNEEGEIYRIVHVMTDIAQQKEAEKALRKLEERYWDLLENANDLVQSATPQGAFLYVNRAWREALGYTPEELTHLSIMDVIHPESRSYCQEVFSRLLKGEDTSKVGFCYLSKDGEKVEVEGGLSCKFVAGEPVYTRGVFKNVTERRRIERERASLQAQLIQAQKMQVIGRLAGGVAHDFNNILTAIQGYAELALLKVDEHHLLQEYLDQIRQASHRAADLVKQLLLFGREQPLEEVPFNLNKAIYDTARMLDRVLGEDITVEILLEPDLWSVKGDASSMAQVLTNLAVNARDAMPQGGTLTIETIDLALREEEAKAFPQGRPGKFVCLRVTDTGAGMDEETLSHIFEPFFTTKEKGKATGLGLPVVYAVVKQHGGWIHVETQVGKGTTFRIYLPAVEEAPEKVSEKITLAMDTKDYGGVILLVEDEDDVRRLAYHFLQDRGFTVYQAPAVGEAQKIFEKEGTEIQLLFSDVVLPDGNGIDLAERLAKLKPELKVLLSSGYTQDKARIESVQEKGWTFVQKPYSLVEIMGIVKKLLKEENP